MHLNFSTFIALIIISLLLWLCCNFLSGLLLCVKYIMQWLTNKYFADEAPHWGYIWSCWLHLVNEAPHGGVWSIHFMKKTRVDTVKKQKKKKKVTAIYLNSLWPSNATWRHRSESTFAQLMTCCLMTPSHYLNQCWLIINEFQWQSPESNFARVTSAISY